MLRKSRGWVNRQVAKDALVILFTACLFYVVYIWRLATLVPGLSKNETSARLASSSLHKIIDNPFYAPHRLLQYIFQQLDYHGPLVMRGVSVFFIIIFLVSMFLTLRLWFGKFIAIAATLLFAFTPWVILLSRSATPYILFLSPILLLFSYIYLGRATKYTILYWFLFIIALAISLYTPGMIWLILAALIIWHRQIVRTVLKVKGVYSVAGLTLLIILLLPLCYGVSRHPSLIKEFFAIPSNFASPFTIVQRIVESFLALFYQLSHTNDYVIGKFALLSVTQTTLAIIGILALRKKTPKMLIGTLVIIGIAVLLAAFNNSIILLSLGLISIAVLDAAGLRYLYQKWFEVFPLNPLAKWFALGLIIAVLFVNFVYGARYALLAWPHNIETRKIYVIK
jgi:4-amino-4-deoxy-L-arabinose transferase-like glycosyltransferase